MSRLLVGKLCLCAVIICLLFSSAPCAAQDGKPSQPGHLVAIMDYDHVFQNSQRYKTELARIKQGVQKAENDLKTLHELVHKLEQEQKTLLPGSPDFLKRQEDATLKKHELQARIQLERTKYEQQRVDLEVKTMREIDDITQDICRKNDIAIVTNVDTRQTRPTDLEAAERQRQRHVLYYNPSLNITTIVLGKMNDAFNEEAKLTDEERGAKAKGVTRPGPKTKPAEPTKK